jgi:hypothetical protein
MTNSTVNLTDYFLTDNDFTWKNIKIAGDDWLDLHCADSVDLNSPPDLFWISFEGTEFYIELFFEVAEPITVVWMGTFFEKDGLRTSGTLPRDAAALLQLIGVTDHQDFITEFWGRVLRLLDYLDLRDELNCVTKPTVEHGPGTAAV